jgi:hypothetical protein
MIFNVRADTANALTAIRESEIMAATVITPDDHPNPSACALS